MHVYAQTMRKLCANYAQTMRKLGTNTAQTFAESAQTLRKHCANMAQTMRKPAQTCLHEQTVRKLEQTLRKYIFTVFTHTNCVNVFAQRLRNVSACLHKVYAVFTHVN
jgi:hypothetical protein